jgi:peroxiredoxin
MSDAVYALYPVFLASDEFRSLDSDELAAVAQEVENLYKDWEGRVDVRGTYSTVGFRADADLMLWLVGSSPEDVQSFLVAFRRTMAGRLLEMTWTFMGVVKPAEFTPDHAPAFVKGTPPKVERSGMLAEHGVMGREFPDVLANTTSAFGLGDWEWILCFEADEADRLVDCIRRLRDARARGFTKVEIPFVTGIRKPVADALADLT